MFDAAFDSIKSRAGAARNGGIRVRGKDMSLHILYGFSRFSTELESDSPFERSASGGQPRCP